MCFMFSFKCLGLAAATLGLSGLAASAAPTYLINQDFEDQTTFPTGTGIPQTGIGDADSSTGFWKSSNTTFLPTPVADPTDPGNHVMAITRNAARNTNLFASSSDAITGGTFTYQFDIYFPTAAGAAFAVSVNNQADVESSAPTTPAGLQFRALSNPDVIVSSTPAEAAGSPVNHAVWGYDLGTMGDIPVATWNTVRAVVDMDQGIWSLYRKSGNDPETNVFTDRALRSDDLSNVDEIGFIVSPPNDGHVVYVDNVQLSRVPEPGTLALLGLGGISLLARRRRRS